MNLRYLARNARSAQRGRSRAIRTGRTFRGHPLWTDREDETFLALYPDYVALRKALKRRSYSALRHRARALKVVKRKHVWTAGEVSRLRRLYPVALRPEIMAALPNLKWNHIREKASRVGVQRKRRPFKTTGDVALDAIRARAFAIGYSMVDVDKVAGTRRYFQRAHWSHGWRSHKAFGRAILALGGTVQAIWTE